MKNIILLLAVISITLVNCKKDNDSPSYNFLDQNLSGKIGGSAWSVQSGWADISTYAGDTTIRINCYDFSSTDPCSAAPSGNEVFFSLPKKTGLYILKFNLSDPQLNRTITLFERDSYTNNIATEGAVEITLISETQIKGRIDARSDDDNFVNGNFTVTLCTE